MSRSISQSATWTLARPLCGSCLATVFVSRRMASLRFDTRQSICRLSVARGLPQHRHIGASMLTKYHTPDRPYYLES